MGQDKDPETGRIIPACAGNSAAWRRHECGPADHPRVCGELLHAASNGTRSTGSSPRVRGTLDDLLVELGELRIIPACAGNSSRRSSESCSTRGSSPRVRGTLPPAGGCNQGRRIIPACAGNSVFSRRPTGRTTDHPRVCGELLSRRTTDCRSTGSSPRVRGTLCVPSRSVTRMRIIPACAGNSSTARLNHSSNSDHPRVCGELLVSGMIGAA